MIDKQTPLQTRKERVKQALFHAGIGLLSILVWIIIVWMMSLAISDGDANVGPDYFALLLWQIVGFGGSAVFVWGIRLLGELFKFTEDHMPRPSDPSSARIREAIFRGVVERGMFTVFAIPFLRPISVDDPYPNPTSGSGFLIAVTLYLTLREKNKDISNEADIYSTWNLIVSVALGVMGGWVFWHPQLWVDGWPF